VSVLKVDNENILWVVFRTILHFYILHALTNFHPIYVYSCLRIEYLTHLKLFHSYGTIICVSEWTLWFHFHLTFSCFYICICLLTFVLTVTESWHPSLWKLLLSCFLSDSVVIKIMLKSVISHMQSPSNLFCRKNGSKVPRSKGRILFFVYVLPLKNTVSCLYWIGVRLKNILFTRKFIFYLKQCSIYTIFQCEYLLKFLSYTTNSVMERMVYKWVIIQKSHSQNVPLLGKESNCSPQCYRSLHNLH